MWQQSYSFGQPRGTSKSYNPHSGLIWGDMTVVMWGSLSFSGIATIWACKQEDGIC